MQARSPDAAISSLPTPSGSGGSSGAAGGSVIDMAAYDAVVAKGAVAADSVVQASAWAKAIKAKGQLVRGGTDTSRCFRSATLPPEGVRLRRGHVTVAGQVHFRRA